MRQHPDRDAQADAEADAKAHPQTDATTDTQADPETDQPAAEHAVACRHTDDGAQPGGHARALALAFLAVATDFPGEPPGPGTVAAERPERIARSGRAAVGRR